MDWALLARFRSTAAPSHITHNLTSVVMSTLQTLQLRDRLRVKHAGVGMGPTPRDW